MQEVKQPWLSTRPGRPGYHTHLPLLLSSGAGVDRQDIKQRVFTARSETVVRYAGLGAGASTGNALRRRLRADRRGGVVLWPTWRCRRNAYAEITARHWRRAYAAYGGGRAAGDQRPRRWQACWRRPHGKLQEDIGGASCALVPPATSAWSRHQPADGRGDAGPGGSLVNDVIVQALEHRLHEPCWSAACWCRLLGVLLWRRQSAGSDASIVAGWR